MSYTINTGTVTGRLTKDADVRTTNSGKTIAKFSMAVNRSKKTASGDWEEVVSFFDVDAFVPEKFAGLLSKGKAVAVEYELRQDRWEDKNSGGNRSKVYLFAKNILLMGGKSEQSDSRTDYQQANYQQPPQYQSPDMSGGMMDDEPPF